MLEKIIDLKDTLEKRIDALVRARAPQRTFIEMLQVTPTAFVPDTESIEKLAEDLIVFYFAGRDTTAHLAYMALYYIARGKNDANGKLIAIQDRVYEEAVKANGDPTAMPYLEQVLYETLRVYGPTVSLFLRKCTSLHTIGDDLKIRPGTHAAIGVVEMHHDPKVWPDPLRFDPDRFAQPDAASKLFSFSHGPRACIGEQLALTFAKIVLSRIVRAYRVTLDDEHIKKPPRMTFKYQYTPEVPFKFVFEERDAK